MEYTVLCCGLVLVCLPVCGHGRGNRAPCAGRAICASFAPLGVYIYAVGGESCTTRLTLLRSARQDPDRDRAWHPRVLGQGNACSSLATGKSSTPPARCIHHSRHDASSAEYRLLALFAPGVASREPESRRSPALAPRTRRLDPTFRCGAFFFVASALADVPSTRLTVSAASQPRRFCRGLVCLKSNFSARKLFYDLRLDLRFVW
jgi:hypothetical protein